MQLKKGMFFLFVFCFFLDFQITLHKKDRDLLDQIKNYFCVGEISKHGEQTINYGIRSIKDLQLIINHFYKFTLMTSSSIEQRLRAAGKG